MKKLFSLALFLLAGLLVGAVLSTMPTAVYAQGGDLDGKAIFLAEKCNLCHSVESQGIESKAKSEKMKGPNLDGCCGDMEADALTQYLKKETEMDGAKHKGSFKGSDEELSALIDWLKEL